MKSQPRFLLETLIVSALLAGSMFLFSCTESTTTANGSGTVRMYMTDAPADYDSVVVVISRVEVQVTSNDTVSGWSTVRADSATYDLLVLRNGSRAILGTSPLLPGHYTQIRLIVGEGSYVIDNGVKHALTIPSGAQSGIKLNHGFDIAAGQTYELLLDFDAEKSIHVTGNGKYMMNPVIRVSAIEATGSIAGVVVPASADTWVWTTMGVDTIATLANHTTGVFVLPGLIEAHYAIHCAPTSTAFRDTVVTNIEVDKMKQTDVGTVALRLW